jgi:hypothetical protein
LPQQLFLVLLQMLHVQIAHRFEPVLMGLDRERPDEPQATFRIRKDPDNMGAPLDLLIETLEHIRGLHVLVMGERKTVITRGFLDILLDPDAELRYFACHFKSHAAMSRRTSESSRRS